MENRSYTSNKSKYKFTNKERDYESSYDYFGARYYDSRIANWGSIDPLLEKHYDCTPYNYVLRNPIRLIDPEGKQIEYYIGMVINKQAEASSATLDYKSMMLEDVNVKGMHMMDAVEKYGSLASEYFGGNLQPTNIELDLALLFTGGGLLTKKGADVTLTKTLSLSEKEATKLSSNKVTEAFEKSVEFLGKDVKVIPTKIGGQFGDKVFVSPTSKIRFDLGYFKPHDYPHVDVEVLKGKAWEKIGKIEFKPKF